MPVHLVSFTCHFHQDEEEEEEFFNQRYARGRDGLISE